MACTRIPKKSGAFQTLTLHPHHSRRRLRLGNGQPILFQPLKMEDDGFRNQLPSFLACLSCCDTAGQVGHVGAVVVRLFLNYDRILKPYHLFPSSLSPACLKILFHVFGFNSSRPCPAIVTRPGLVGCLYCLWLPLVLTISHPSSSIILIASRTLTAMAPSRRCPLVYSMSYTQSSDSHNHPFPQRRTLPKMGDKQSVEYQLQWRKMIAGNISFRPSKDLFKTGNERVLPRCTRA